MTEERKFRIITNEKAEEDKYKKKKLQSYQTNPMNIQGQSLREQLMRFHNEEAGRRFTVEDLLRGC